MKKIILVLLFLILSSNIFAKNDPCAKYKENFYFECALIQREGGPKHVLPQLLLDQLVETIRFAFKEGSAREISGRDLYHAHILFRPGNHNIYNFDGILLHSQEFVKYSPESYRKRNIFSRRNETPVILPCEMGQDIKKSYKDLENICAVVSQDLGMLSPYQFYFIRIDNLPDELKMKAEKHKLNRRLLNGQYILFFLGG